MADGDTITAEIARKLLNYDPDTGVFRWKARSVDMFDGGKQTAEHNCSAWNGRFAGAIAGSLNGQGYMRMVIFSCTYSAHRLAWLWMTGKWPDDEIDHKNLNPADNRWINLRPATKSQNNANRRAYSNNTSGFKGVTWNKQKRKWHAQIRRNGRQIFLGYFDAAEDAHIAYCIAADRLFDAFARVA